MPPGFPTAMGSPVQEPFLRRQDAQDSALRLLTGIVRLIKQNQGQEKAPPKFEFHDLIVTLQLDVLELLVGHGIKLSFPAETAIANLQALDRDYGIIDTEQAFRALPESVQQRYMARIYMAAALGIFRYPLIEAKQPSPDYPNGDKQRH
jgi:hypothetical protein